MVRSAQDGLQRYLSVPLLLRPEKTSQRLPDGCRGGKHRSPPSRLLAVPFPLLAAPSVWFKSSRRGWRRPGVGRYPRASWPTFTPRGTSLTPCGPIALPASPPTGHWVTPPLASGHASPTPPTPS